MFPSVNPSTATLTSSSPIKWVGGTLFDGFVMLGLCVPSGTTGAWPSLSIGQGKYPSQKLPIWTVVPIVQGVLDPSAKLFFNSAIDPPGSKYAAYWLDSTKRRLYPSGEGTLFTIETSPYNLTVPALPDMTPASVAVSPEDTTTTSSEEILTPLTITGTQDGSNLIFTLSAFPVTALLLYVGGQLLAEGTDFTRSGVTITFSGSGLGSAPLSTDVLQAFALGGTS